MPNDRPFVAPVAMIAGATGARCMTGIAAIAHTRADQQDAEHIDAQIARVTAAMALGELVGDKLPNIGNRTDPGPLLGRLVAGAVIGAAVANLTGHDRRNAAIGGAVAALVGAHLSFQFRKSLSRHLPPILAALVEDVAVLGLAAAGTTMLGPRRDPAIYLGTESAAGARRQIATARILTESTESSPAERAPS